MPVFRISINYTTWDSIVPAHVEEEEIGLVTADISIALRNLKRIQLHYEAHKEDPDFDRSYSLTLKTDFGDRTIEPFWIGFSSVLNSAKIVSDDMGFTVNAKVGE